MTDFEYQRTLMIGVIIGACITILGFYMLKPSPESHTVTPKTSFAVVDTYMGCDIIKRENKSVFESQYFMDCNNK